SFTFYRGVKDALKKIQGLNLIQISDLESFFGLDELSSDLYIMDRHFPEKPGQKAGDTSWRKIAEFVRDFYPETPIILLSGAIPRNWRDYTSIRYAVPKRPFSSQNLYSIVESIINGGEK
ncbi:MAG: hypothetical protein AABW81_02725, partial [Nanoarchaeota archaeon]